MQAIEIERSPGLPSLMVTTRRRLMPQGTSCSFLHAVTQALHSMQRSASQRNFIRAMCVLLSGCDDLTKRDLRLLHARCGIVAVARDRVCALTQHDRIRAGGIVLARVGAAEPATEMERHPGNAFADALGHQRLHPRPRIILGAAHPDPAA